MPRHTHRTLRRPRASTSTTRCASRASGNYVYTTLERGVAAWPLALSRTQQTQQREQQTPPPKTTIPKKALAARDRVAALAGAALRRHRPAQHRRVRPALPAGADRHQVSGGRRASGAADPIAARAVRFSLGA
jgi:hypothetical protein